jgi:sec-independent protein translocase protein TatA
MFGGWELLIVVVIVMALFGVKRLPDMARSVGQTARVFKGEMRGLREDGAALRDAATSEPQPAPVALAPSRPLVIDQVQAAQQPRVAGDAERGA